RAAQGLRAGDSEGIETARGRRRRAEKRRDHPGDLPGRKDRPRDQAAAEKVVVSLRRDDYFFGFGSRFASSSATVTCDSTPFSGTFTFASHRNALRTTLRNWSLPQLSWKRPPVKPNPRPPSRRSTAHIIASARPLAA